MVVMSAVTSSSTTSSTTRPRGARGASSRRRARRERFKGFEGFEGFENEDEDEDEEASRGRGRGRGRRRRVDARRERRGSGDGFEASANVVKLAYKALTGVSEAFTRALDVVLPRWVPMYVIRLVVACGWGAFALASATRLIYGVVVVGAVLCLFVALGNDAGDGGRERAAGIYEYATGSSPRGPGLVDESRTGSFRRDSG